MATLATYDPDFTLFLECGFIAVNQADEPSARSLFHACEILRPENYIAKIGWGYMHLLKLELKEAIKNFEEVLKKEPGNEMARAFMGLAQCLTPDGVTKGEKMLHESERSHDKEVKKMSQTAIEFVEKFVKKEPSPAELQKKKKHK